jgi:hypothetical protein
MKKLPESDINSGFLCLPPTTAMSRTEYCLICVIRVTDLQRDALLMGGRQLSKSS